MGGYFGAASHYLISDYQDRLHCIFNNKPVADQFIDTPALQCIGPLLLRSFLQFCRYYEHEEAYCYVMPDNDEAIAFYERAGMTVDRSDPKLFLRRADWP